MAIVSYETFLARIKEKGFLDVMDFPRDKYTGIYYNVHGVCKKCGRIHKRNGLDIL